VRGVLSRYLQHSDTDELLASCHLPNVAALVVTVTKWTLGDNCNGSTSTNGLQNKLQLRWHTAAHQNCMTS
jgi:hypothetical protein